MDTTTTTNTINTTNNISNTVTTTTRTISGTSIPTNTISISGTSTSSPSTGTYYFKVPNTYGRISAQDLVIHDSYEFKDIKELVPEKVYEFTFYGCTKPITVKTVCESGDTFNLEYAFYLALAKALYSKEYTFEGVLNKAEDLRYIKRYNKYVQKVIKLFKKIQKEKAKEEEKEAIKKRQHKKYVEKKKEAKERKRKNQVNIIAEAIRLSKEEG